MIIPGKARQRGVVRFTGLLLLAVLAGVAYVGAQVIPLEFHNYELQNRLAQEARIVTFYNSDNAHIRSQVLADAQALHLPLRSQQIVIERTGGAVTIQVEMSVPVKIPFYQWRLNFSDNSASAL